ncbi:ABC transporter permease [Acidisoma cellulosilytica]|uniref:ABC transporter permease n=1 Tax=Acidisoma cellulosilyticum TaxID=2802395 RepID=A0A963Z2U6_9PROT|nr:ABC transporter permease [Acidisoma cellulosilyticum]MCB8881501.1 ABC transporter permease [Acidisoma cellulosilyticum]
MSITATTALPRNRARRLPEQVLRLGIVVLLIVVITVLGCLVSDRFGTLNNFLNVYEQSTDLALVALGQTLTILTGGIDLSVGSMISLLSVLTSGIINSNGDLVLPVCAGIIVLGMVIGLINGIAIVMLRVHPLIVTLGTGAVLQGLALLYTMAPAGGVPDGFDFLAYGRIADISVGATIVLLVYLLASFLMRRTATGRNIYAIGDDRHAAVLLGLPVKRLTMLVYTLSGLLCAMTAIYLVARFGSGQPYAGANYTLASVTPVVVGGTMLSGGRGGVIGTLLGAYLIALLNDFLNFLHVSTEIQLVVQGLIIMLAVSAYREGKRG